MKKIRYPVLLVSALILVALFTSVIARSQNNQTIQINTNEVYQTITGFGASLAYYEGWLTAHPNKSEIYNVIFSELSLDILRVRNAYGYDSGMIDRVKEFALEAESSLGHPIDLMVTSWGPPAYLKSNNDKNNGGTLKYTISGGNVNFDYAGFAKWWDESLDNYNAYGIYPKYISIQNEPDWKASYESCLLRPAEVVNATETIAGYNKALDAVYDTVKQRANSPVFLGPECIGIGYNAVENYINALDLSKLYGIAHHLYHGAEGGTVEGDPFTSSDYQKVGDFYPEVPHFQTEYSRADWYSLAAMMFQTLTQENAAAFLYWDLIWSEAGLVSLDFPWDQSRWTNSVGYHRTKDFYVFKHYSAFIHPGWKRIGTSLNSELIKTAAFISSSVDSATFVVMNRSATETFNLSIQIPGFVIDEATNYSTTVNNNFVTSDYLAGNKIQVAPKSVNTISIRLTEIPTGLADKQNISGTSGLEISIVPNPFTVSTQIQFESEKNADFSLDVFDVTGRKVSAQKIGFFLAGKNNYTFNREGLKSGIYFYLLKSSSGKTGLGRFIIAD